MAICPKRLKPRHIAVQGLRILLLHVVDELCGSLPDAPGTGKPGVTQGDMRSSPAQPVLIKVTTVGESFSLLGLCVTSVALQHGAQSGSMDMADLQICRFFSCISTCFCDVSNPSTGHRGIRPSLSRRKCEMVVLCLPSL